MKSFALTAGALALAACASKPALSPLQSEQLITQINADGMKQFHYKITLAHGRGGRDNGPSGSHRSGGNPPPDGGPNGGPGMGGAPGGGRGPGNMKPLENTETAIAERLDLLLAESQFCDNGYFIIRKTMAENVTDYFGECKARANN